MRAYSPCNINVFLPPGNRICHLSCQTLICQKLSKIFKLLAEVWQVSKAVLKQNVTFTGGDSTVSEVEANGVVSQRTLPRGSDQHQDEVSDLWLVKSSPAKCHFNKGCKSLHH